MPDPFVRSVGLFGQSSSRLGRNCQGGEKNNRGVWGGNNQGLIEHFQ